MNNICASKPAPPTVIMMSSIANLQLRSTTRRQKRRERAALIVIVSVTALASALSDLIGRPLCLPAARAVSVQRLTVPDLVVVDQLSANQAPPAIQPTQMTRSGGDQLGGAGISTRTQSIYHSSSWTTASNLTQQQQPVAASLINSQDLSSSSTTTNGNQHQYQQHTNNEQQQLTFECLISYDRKKDKNLIIKWHHDDRVEPIYQWIVELDKISIAPQYKPYILANNSTTQRLLRDNPPAEWQQQLSRASALSGGGGANSTVNPNNQVHLLEASFRLIRPSKELGGKYTCSAISVQNDDSKWRKMIVFTPPRSFKFNATRADFGQPAGQSEQRLLSPRAKQTTPQLPLTATNQPAALTLADHQSGAAPAAANELPLAYRSRGFDGQPTSTISPQMYKTIDYVNVRNPTNYRPSSRPTPLDGSGGGNTIDLWQQQQQQRRLMAGNGGVGGRYSGVKLVCDIDQIFPVPEVSIYRLATTSGSGSTVNASYHPMDKLTKSETRIEKNPLNGLYHIQVISVLLDDEIELKYGSNEPVYFECLIGLTNLELSKYSDNKRSLVYRPSATAAAGAVSPASSSSQQGMQSDQLGNDMDTERSSSSPVRPTTAAAPAAAVYVLLPLLMMMMI